jgi:hypothetical protein
MWTVTDARAVRDRLDRAMSTLSFTGPVRRLAAPVTSRVGAVERDLVDTLFAPMGVLLQTLDQSAAAMHAQADGFEAAAASFHRTAQLLHTQAIALEAAAESLRDPTYVLRAAGGRLTRRDDGGAADD